MPDGVEISTSPGRITVKGPKGSLDQELSPDMAIAHEGSTLVVSRPTDRADHRALHGLTRSLVANMVEGVTKGYESGSKSRESATVPLPRVRISSSLSASRTPSP